MFGSGWGAAAAVLSFLLFQVCGMGVLRPALREESPAVRLLLGSVCGSVMLQWFPVLFAFFLGFTLPAHLLGLLLAALLALVSLYIGRKKPYRAGLWKDVKRHPFLLAVLALLAFFCYLVLHGFSVEEGVVYSSQATYGDMSMHLSFITSLARQGAFPPDYSILPGTRLSYPFLSDSISSSLYLLGAPLRLAYCLPMFFAGAQVFGGFYLLAVRWLKGRGKAALSFLFFFFCGGMGFLYFLGGSWENFTRIFTGFYETPTNLVGENIRWVNVVVDMMLPQRASLFGWAVLFPLLYLLYRAVFERRNRYFLLAGLLGGALPMIHTHSFLALALVCGVWLMTSLLRLLRRDGLAVKLGKISVAAGLILMSALQIVCRRFGWEESPWLLYALLMLTGLFLLLLALLFVQAGRLGYGRKLLATWGVLFGVVCLLALPQLLYWTFRQAQGESFVRGHFGWAVGDDQYLWFYLKNIGVVSLLALAGLLTAKKRSFLKCLPALFIWLVAELALFQPNEYDNNKLLYVAYALLCMQAAEFAGNALHRLKRKPARNAAAAVLLSLSCISAALTMGREAVARYELFGSGAVKLSSYVEENLPPDAIVLTNTRHNNEIAALTGRNVVCGSPSYLFYHGLDYYENEVAVQTMYEYPVQAKGLFELLQVDYVLISDFERGSYCVDEEAFTKRCALVYNDGNRYLYRCTFIG